MPTPTPSVRRFEHALSTIPRPKGRQLKFLQAHFSARARGLNARRLARAAGYAGYRGINLHYGLLAASIARELGIRGVGIELLVEGLPPGQASNQDWVLIMRPRFAQALRNVGWVS